MSKTLLVTGASADLGIALIRAVARDYDLILAHYCHWNENLEQLKQEFKEKIQFLQADFSSPSSVQSMLAEIQGHQWSPDHVVHLSAPKVVTERFKKTDWAVFDAGWKVSVHSIITLLQVFLPQMAKRHSGKVIFMLSAYTIDWPPKYQTAYCTIKYALLGLMKSLAAEYQDKGIAINGVSPDMIQTKFLSQLPQLMIDQYEHSRPLQKLLNVDEVIPTFQFLLSEGGDRITGENLGIRL